MLLRYGFLPSNWTSSSSLVFLVRRKRLWRTSQVADDRLERSRNWRISILHRKNTRNSLQARSSLRWHPRHRHVHSNNKLQSHPLILQIIRSINLQKSTLHPKQRPLTPLPQIYSLTQTERQTSRILTSLRR